MALLVIDGVGRDDHRVHLEKELWERKEKSSGAGGRSENTAERWGRTSYTCAGLRSHESSAGELCFSAAHTDDRRSLAS
jgi:hypothetical protein